jgi:hypothetical protein
MQRTKDAMSGKNTSLCADLATTAHPTPEESGSQDATVWLTGLPSSEHRRLGRRVACVAGKEGLARG